MKKVEVSVDFIKEAHQSACANWKQRIEKELPDLFNKLEVGKWYKVIDKTNQFTKNEFALIYFDNNENHFGISFRQKWTIKFVNLLEVLKIDTDEVVLATEEEVKTALVNEAVKRGFELGKKVKWDFHGSEGYKCSNITKDYFEYFVNENKLELSCGIIFDNGKWAILITEPTENELLGNKIKELEKNLEEVKSLYNKL